MSRDEIRVGILGFGIVGGGTYEVLCRNAESIRQRVGVPVRVVRIADIDWSRDRGLDVPEELQTTDAAEVYAADDIDIVVETIGGVSPASDFVLAAIANGKSVVTSNKEMMAKRGAEILDAAAAAGVDVEFEGAVGGTIPIIRALKESLEANRIEEVTGILNGTTNYILTRMTEEGSDYAEVLADAQALGYAEADPTNDVEGIDAKYKIAILSAIAFGHRISYDEIHNEGITKISAADIDYATEMGYAIKLLATARRDTDRLDVRVHPALVPKSHPLAQVNGVFNAVWVVGDACDQVMLYGRGAGALPTGSAVAGDILDCARNILSGSRSRVPCTCRGVAHLMPMEDVRSRNYVRMRVKDRPGVLGSIATIFGQEGVSIESVVQRGGSKNGLTEIVWIMHEGPERELHSALGAIGQLGIVDEVCSVLRVID
ncbi:MAG TPA: homoserine dehydrogenase [Armatimonadetes bacterium]|nr:homoserine dehydrogenase [Armatimonadota bacterium]